MKIAVDTLMTAALLFLMGYQSWGETAHEWVGQGNDMAVQRQVQRREQVRHAHLYEQRIKEMLLEAFGILMEDRKSARRFKAESSRDIGFVPDAFGRFFCVWKSIRN